MIAVPVALRSLRELALLCAATLIAAPLNAQSSALPELAAGDELRDTIEDGAEVVSTEILAAAYTNAPTVGRRYRLEVKRSGAHTIDLRSAYFDGYLVLRNGKNEVVAEDDDGLVAMHARIVAELDADETYVLEACALHGQRGAYTLSMEKGAKDPDEGIDWDDEEIQVRIQTAFEEDHWDKIDVVKSKRYLIFTDSGAGKKFGKILDKDIYEGFRDEFEFEEPENARRMPVYLFNTRERYVTFLMNNLGMSEAQAKATGGIQYMDFYATWYSSPRDPTHFHECAHQIMSNILKLGGGGSWFQEGVAEYYEDKISKFNREAETRNAIRSDQTVSWQELLSAPSMLFSAGENLKGGGGAAGNYGQAASVIMFFKDGPRKKQFQEFLHAMGRVPRSDMQAIEATFQELFGVGIDELEAEWREYFAG